MLKTAQATRRHLSIENGGRNSILRLRISFWAISLLLAILVFAVDVHAQPPDTLWTRTFGGSNIDVGYCVQQTRDDGYVVAGYTLSYGAGVHGVWLVRIAPDATEVDEAHAALDRYQLAQNYPNPFNPTTNISFAIPVGGIVKISVYDLLGNEVRTLLDSYVGRGTGMVSWDGRDAKGRMASTGIYFCRMTSGSFAQSLQMLLPK